MLLEARAPRVRPGLDDKVLADWNGLMIAALADAGLAFGRPRMGRAWRSAPLRFVVDDMAGADGRLRHSWRGRRARHPASVDDYANLCRAALALHEATWTSRPIWRRRARGSRCSTGIIGTRPAAAISLRPTTPTDLIARAKTAADAAVPSGNGTMVGVLTRLALLTGDDAYRRRAEAVIAAFAGEVAAISSRLRP